MSNNLFRTGIKLLIISIAILAATYAWFMNSSTTTTGQLNASTNPVNNIQISLDGGTTWEDLSDLNLNSNFAFATEVTGNGVEFYKANIKDEDGTPSNFIEAIDGKDYLEFQVMFKADLETVIFLDTKSYVNPAAGTTSGSLIGPGVTRISSLGNFSKDLIAGAVRVAFIENDYVSEEYVPQSSTKMVWAPNKGYEIAYNSGTYNAYINSTSAQNYNYLQITSPTVFDEARVVNLKDNISASYQTKMAGGDPMLTYIPCDTENELDHIRALTVRIWVEGNDRETTLALKGGLFKFLISFVGITKNFDDVAPSVSVSFDTISGFASGMEYSKDFGNNWVKHSSNPNPTFNSGDTVYVRKAETGSNFASAYTTLNF